MTTAERCAWATLSVVVLFASLQVDAATSTQRPSNATRATRGPVEDLAGLAGKQAPARDHQDQLAAANGEWPTRAQLPQSKLANYINRQHQDEQLMRLFAQIGAHDQLPAPAASTELPQGRRRLDLEASPAVSMGEPVADGLSPLERMALAASLSNSRRAGRRAANEHMHSQIVDQGHVSSDREFRSAAGGSRRAPARGHAKRKLQSQESRARSGKSYPARGRSERLVEAVDEPEDEGGAESAVAPGGATEEEDAERASDRRADEFDRDDGEPEAGRDRAKGRDEFGQLDRAADASGAHRDAAAAGDDDDDQANAAEEDDDDDDQADRPARQTGSRKRRGRAKRLRQAASSGSQRQSAPTGPRRAYEGSPSELAYRPRSRPGHDDDDDDGAAAPARRRSSRANNDHEDESTDSTDARPRRLASRRTDETNNMQIVEVAREPAGASAGPLQADLQTAAGHHHGHSHGHYYQFVEVPKKKAWKFGFKRGNHKHEISRKEKGYKHKFHSEFHWHAKEKCKKKKKCKSVGKMTWDYKHHKKHH